jgi:signal transduction histidine kinase
MKLLKIVIILLFSFSLKAKSLEDLVPIVPDDIGKNITEKLLCKKGLSKTVIKSDELNDLEPIKNEIKVPYTNSATGFIFKVGKGFHDEKLILHFNHALSGQIELFQLKSGGDWKRLLVTGSEIPYKKRIVKGYELALPFEFHPEDEKTFLVRRLSHHRFDAQVTLKELDEFTADQTVLKTYYYFYIGALFSLIFYNLFLFFATREKNYLYYCLFGFAISMTVIAMTGFIDNLFGFMGVSLSQHLILFSSSSLMTSIIFVRNFLSLDRYSPKIVKALKFVFGATLFIFIASLGPWGKHLGGAHLGTLVDICIPLGILLMIAGAVIAFNKGNVMAKFYLTSWFFMFGGTFLYFAHYAGILERNFLTSHAIMWGNVLEMIVVSLGLAYKIAILDREKKEALIMARGKREYERMVRVLLHDIGNPLNLIRYYLNLKTKSPEKFEKNEEKAWEKINLGAEKIKDIIAFHRDQEMNMAKDGHQLNLVEVNLKEVLEELKALFEESLEFKQLKFEITGEQESIPSIKAEKTSLINEVFNNIVSNAIKFSFEGGKIEIAVSTEGENIIARVIDQGKGITQERIRHFQEKGSLNSEKGTLGEEGTGFGLYLAKSYMELYGGSMSIESTSIQSDRRNHGSTFILSFKKY